MEKRKTPRPKENKNTKPIRVENIEVYKQGDNDRSFQSIIGDKERNQGYVNFYDLSVKEDHTYFANGILVHNCHHLHTKKSQYATVMEMNLSPMRIGFTATLPTTKDGKLFLEGYLGPVVKEVTVQEGIESGTLAKPYINLVPVPFSPTVGALKKFKDIYSQGVVHNRMRNRIITKLASQRVDKGESVLIMVKEIDHGDLIVEMAEEVFGMEAYFVRGKTDGETREKVRVALDDKFIKCVVATVVWREGVNIRSLNCVVNAAGGRSELMALQAIGRGLRTTKSKKTVEIIDFLDRYKYLAQHAIERISIYVEKKWI